MIAARLGTRAALHQVGALLNQRVSALVCVGVCVGVCAQGLAEYAGQWSWQVWRCVEVCVCGVGVGAAAVQGRSRLREARRKDFNHLVFVF